MIRKFIGMPLVAAALLSFTLLTGCDNNSSSSGQTTTGYATSTVSSDSASGSDFDSRPSDAPRINIQLVEQALSQVQQTDPQGWMQAFEQRVNEIYDGKDVVSIDARPDSANNLQIIGYISHSGQQGYQAGVDDELFAIQQTGTATANNTPYRMTYYTYGGTPAYYDGYYSNPFMTAWMINSMMYHTWGGYYTSPSRIVVINSYRTTYRTSPAFVQQRIATRDYYHQAYHGAPVTVRPGTSIGAGVTARPGAAVAAPAHVTPPPAYKPSGSIFNRGGGVGAGAPSAVTPPRAAAPTSIFNRPNPSLQNRPGGLFNRSTFGGSGSGYRSSGSSFRSSGGGRRH